MEWGEVTTVTVSERGWWNRGWRDYPDLVDAYNNHVSALMKLNLCGGKMSDPTVIKARNNPNPQQFNSDNVSYSDSRVSVDEYFLRQYGKYFSIWPT